MRESNGEENDLKVDEDLEIEWVSEWVWVVA